MAAMAQLHYSPLSNHHLHHRHFSVTNRFPSSNHLRSNKNVSSSTERFKPSFSAGDGGSYGIGRGGGSGGGNGGFGSGDGGSSHFDDSSSSSWGLLGFLLKGWHSRVAVDPEFPFKVLMEEVVGVSSSVIGDMASRPNFGLNELDFVFSTLVVGLIVNFTLMYLLAPTATSAGTSLPGIFAACPNSHMFEPGAYSLLQRCGTFVYKGTIFATVGFTAGLVGTAISNGLVKMRKKMDPTSVTTNKSPPTLLNAITWSIHMGVNSNFRYQTLNGVEFALAKSVPPVVFKSSVVILRSLNNVLGGMSFVVLARLTGSQSSADDTKTSSTTTEIVALSDGSSEKEKLVDSLPSNQST